MASPDQAFTEPERATLLKEILISALPQSNPRSQILAAVVRDLQIQPLWDDIRLPQGRTVGQCKNVFQDIMSSISLPQPRIQTDVRPQPPIYPPVLAPQPDYPYGGRRALQPKPPHYARFSSESPLSPYSPSASEAISRKRGRPNREESERRQRARDEAAARGEKDPYPSRSRKKQRAEPGPSASASRAITSSQPPPSTLGPLGISAASSTVSTPGSQSFTTPSEPFAQAQTAPGPSLPPLYASAPRPSHGGTIGRQPFEPSSSSLRASYGGMPRPPSPGRPAPVRRLSGSYASDSLDYRTSQTTQPPPPPLPRALSQSQSQSQSAPPLQTPENRPEANGSHRQQTSSSPADPMEQT